MLIRKTNCWFLIVGLIVISQSFRLTISVAFGQSDPSRFATSDSRSDYVHRIELFDADNSRILPGNASLPYSPARTCGRCHDYKHITTGFHFNPDSSAGDHGRPAETFIWVDPTTGTQLPVSLRDWKNSFTPNQLGISDWEFDLKFGGRTAGGYGFKRDAESTNDQTGEPQQKAAIDRFHLTGELDTDCMMCHSRDSVFDIESWNKQIDNQNFAWAATAAIGLAKVDGQVRRLKDDFDIEASKADQYSGPKLPTTKYDENRFDAEGKVFFDIVRMPSNNACYRCHSNLSVGAGSSPRWTHDNDVHIRAGFACVDCHRNGIGHNIVRGFENEIHPHQAETENLSCRGCHMASDNETLASQSGGGRMGAPLPLHKGLPPVHLERMSCTACHSGPRLTSEIGLLQTALAHQLGLKEHRNKHQQPKIARTVFLPDEENVLYPYRMMWPSFWGVAVDKVVTPLNPNDSHQWLRSTLRIRKDFEEEMAKTRLSKSQRSEILGTERAKLKEDELNDEEKRKLAELKKAQGIIAIKEKIEKALLKLRQEITVGQPVYVCGEDIYQLDGGGKLEIVNNPHPKPYSWPIGHDVRPARWALGANGCKDCHANDSPFFYATVITQSPLEVNEPVARPMHEYSKLDASLLGTWNQLFEGRTAFKWTAFASLVSVILAVIVFCLFSFAGIIARTSNRN